MLSGEVWAGHMQIIIIIGGDLQTTRVLVDKGIIVIIPAKKAPLPPAKSIKVAATAVPAEGMLGQGLSASLVLVLYCVFFDEVFARLERQLTRSSSHSRELLTVKSLVCTALR